MSATPRPWGIARMDGAKTIYAGKALDNRPGLLRIERGGVSGVAVCPDDEVGATVAKSNARLIVRAVNAHEALVEALKGAVALIEETDWLAFSVEDRKRLDAARAALKLAGVT